MYVCMHVCVCVYTIVSIVRAATFSAAALLISSASVTIGLNADTCSSMRTLCGHRCSSMRTHIPSRPQRC